MTKTENDKSAVLAVEALYLYAKAAYRAIEDADRQLSPEAISRIRECLTAAEKLDEKMIIRQALGGLR